MNFDDLKRDWKAEEAVGKHLEINLSKKREARTSIDNIRKKMKQEYVVNVLLTILAIAFAVFQVLAADVKIFTILIMAIYMGSWAFLSIAYYKRFRKFYKQSYHLEYNSLDNLRWFAYEMRTNLESYKLLTFSSIIVGFGAGVMYIGIERGTNYEMRIGELLQGNFGYGIWTLSFLAVYFTLLISGTYWFARMAIRRYEKPLKQIELSIQYLQEFEMEETDN